MSYYHCSTEQLRIEAQRRGFVVLGTRDQLSEALKRDDEERGSDATTVTTEKLGMFLPRDVNLSRTAEFGQTTPANFLVGERIVYWTMNTFFPTLQLFFASGRSCTIDGGQLPDAMVGLDPQLRFRLTDCTYEEEGRLTKSMRPEKFPEAVPGILIREAVVAKRTSIAMKSGVQNDNAGDQNVPMVALDREAHTVIGLRLEGMQQVAYVSAKCRPHPHREGRTWGDARIGAFRNDVPSPLIALPLDTIKAGGEVVLVDNKSQIRGVSSMKETAELPRSEGTRR